MLFFSLDGLWKLVEAEYTFAAMIEFSSVSFSSPSWNLLTVLSMFLIKQLHTINQICQARPYCCRAAKISASSGGKYRKVGSSSFDWHAESRSEAF